MNTIFLNILYIVSPEIVIPWPLQGTAQRCALLALGRAAERRPMRKRLRRRKCLKNAPTPQRQVHAVLGSSGYGNDTCFSNF